MPKYYCDYCDAFLTHDSPSVRKTHNGGRKHKENVRHYYQAWMENQAQKLIDATTKAFTTQRLVAPLPGMVPPPLAAMGMPMNMMGMAPRPFVMPGMVRPPMGALPPGAAGSFFPPPLPAGLPSGVPQQQPTTTAIPTPISMPPAATVAAPTPMVVDNESGGAVAPIRTNIKME